MKTYTVLFKPDHDYAIQTLVQAYNAMVNDKAYYIRRNGPTDTEVELIDLSGVAVLKNGLPVAILEETMHPLKLVMVKEGKLYLTDFTVGGDIDNSCGEVGDTEISIEQYNRHVWELVNNGWLPDDSSTIAAFWLVYDND